MEAGKNRLFFSLMLMGLMVSCVKDPQDIPPGLTGDSSFGMVGTFGGDPIEIEAGTANWTALPLVLKEDSLHVYTSVMSAGGCIDQCSPSWTIRFYEAWPIESDPAVAFSKTISLGAKDFVMSEQELDSFDISLSTHPALFMSGYSYWEDINSSSSFYFNEFLSTVGYEENINVCFQSFAYTGCQYRQCLTFDPSDEKPCHAIIEAKLESNYISLSVRPQGTPPFIYQWFTEAGTPSIVIPLQDSVMEAEIYAGVTVIDALGNRTDLNQSIRLQNGVIDNCYFPIDISIEPVDYSTSLHFSDKIEITFTDENGDVWSSSFGPQNVDSGASIDMISTYGLSPSGQPTSLVDVSIRARLYKGTTGESKWFETERLSIPLSRP